MGGPHLAFEMWDTTNLNKPISSQHERVWDAPCGQRDKISMQCQTRLLSSFRGRVRRPLAWVATLPSDFP